ncbi:hypothetical protein DFJ74DRAFT_43134 [Hyaloraphidium curvatum]|nr:hypothetical protein DFJ74DRAFT_43134 [Hyaloraphidium curvatum]
MLAPPPPVRDSCAEKGVNREKQRTRPRDHVRPPLAKYRLRSAGASGSPGRDGTGSQSLPRPPGPLLRGKSSDRPVGRRAESAARDGSQPPSSAKPSEAHRRAKTAPPGAGATPLGTGAWWRERQSGGRWSWYGRRAAARAGVRPGAPSGEGARARSAPRAGGAAARQ